MKGANALRIVSCGPGASLQDGGRFGLQRYGVSPAGAMDGESLATANALVGNAPAAAAIEAVLTGGAFLVEGGPALVAATGAELSIGGRRIPPLTAAVAEPGETILLGPARDCVYAYVAIAGGFAVEPELGSLSLHRRSGIGGAPLAAGDLLALGPAAPASRPLRLPEARSRDEAPIRIMPGPQAQHVGEAAVALLLTGAFTISRLADRMGVRLDGPAITPEKGFNIVSDGIATGAIQIPGDARPIVLMRDRQTTGGYPKIATIITADLDRFAQLPPGHAVRFILVSREEAVAAARARRQRLETLPARLVPAGSALSTERLLSLNLIDGVTAG